MASPPFNINQAIPGDSDIVSQHPGNARTFRDVVESWLLVNHNVNGRHDVIGMDVAATPTGIDSVVKLWADTDGNLRALFGSLGNAFYVGPPPGSIFDYAGSTAPEGYLLCYGQAVSRTTYAVLFSKIGTTFGIGDASTTFNLPDVRGRVGVGKDDMGGSAASRVTTAGSTFDAATLGAVGGAQTMVIAQANLPVVTLTTTIAAGQGSHVHREQGASGSSTDLRTLIGFTPNNETLSLSSTAAATLPEMTGTTPLGGSATALAIVQPGISFNKIIKY